MLHACLQMRCLQMWLLSIYRPHMDHMEARVIVFQMVLASLTWWIDPSKVMFSTPFTPPAPQATITTDVSFVGWGAHHTAQGVWMPWEARMHINMLELQLVHFIYQAFLLLIWALHIQLLSDNTAVVYINKQSGTKSSSLCSEFVHLWNWCIK